MLSNPCFLIVYPLHESQSTRLSVEGNMVSLFL